MYINLKENSTSVDKETGSHECLVQALYTTTR